MIFRRRTTDQVYATLQQVQRRITEQGGATTPVASPAPRAPGTGTFRHAATPMRTPPAGALTPAGGQAPAPTQRETPVPEATTAASQEPATRSGNTALPGRRVLELPTQLAATLMLVWLLTLVVAFFIGRVSAPATAEVVPAPVAHTAKGQDPESTNAEKSIFVLKAIPRFDPADKIEWKKRADDMNAQCRKSGWKDYFAIREPKNGGLELVYGCVNGQFGIDRNQFRDFAAMLQRPKENQGAGYTTAVWKAVE